MNVRALLTVRGKVQGVSFRKHTLRMAQELRVSGWVRNLDNGSVQGCFEGPRSQVEALIAWCSLGPERAVVEALTSEFHSFTGEFQEFCIR